METNKLEKYNNLISQNYKTLNEILEENNIPVNEEIVKIVLRRYLNGKYKLDGKKLVKKVEE